MKNEFKRVIVVALLFITVLVACSYAPNSDIKRIEDNDQPTLLHDTGNTKMYIKVIHVGGSYSSHVVWTEDNSGQIISIATR